MISHFAGKLKMYSYLDVKLPLKKNLVSSKMRKISVTFLSMKTCLNYESESIICVVV